MAFSDAAFMAGLEDGASVQTTDTEFPQIAAAIHQAGFSTREYVVCFLTLLQTQNAVHFKNQDKSKQYPPYVNPINTKLLEDHWGEVTKILTLRGLVISTSLRKPRGLVFNPTLDCFLCCFDQSWHAKHRTL
jgi:hypothetical protein